MDTDYTASCWLIKELHLDLNFLFHSVSFILFVFKLQVMFSYYNKHVRLHTVHKDSLKPGYLYVNLIYNIHLPCRPLITIY